MGERITSIEELMASQIPKTEEKFFQEARAFLKSIEAKVRAIEPQFLQLRSDHVCYRVDSISNYQEMFKLITSFSKLLTEAQVNGRPIATFKMLSPLQSVFGPIFLVELPSPKANTHYQNGFEHMEFVIQEDLGEFQRRFSHLNLEMGSAMPLNTELSLKLDDHSQIKFHNHPLDEVIRVEETKITDFIFDLDNTLADSHHGVLEATKEVIENIKGKIVGADELNRVFAPEFSLLFSNLGVPAEGLTAAVKSWGQAALKHKSKAFAGVVDLLKKLQDKKMNLHIWTGRDETSAMKILEGPDFKNINWASVTCWSKEAAKPNKDLFLKNAKGIHLEHALLLGDSATDVRAAKNLGVISAVSLWGEIPLNKTKALQEGAHLFFDKPTQILDFLS